MFSSTAPEKQGSQGDHGQTGAVKMETDRMAQKLGISAGLQFLTAAFLSKRGSGDVNMMPGRAFLVATLVVGGGATAVGAAVYHTGIRSIALNVRMSTQGLTPKITTVTVEPCLKTIFHSSGRDWRGLSACFNTSHSLQLVLLTRVPNVGGPKLGAYSGVVSPPTTTTSPSKLDDALMAGEKVRLKLGQPPRFSKDGNPNSVAEGE